MRVRWLVLAVSVSGAGCSSEPETRDEVDAGRGDAAAQYTHDVQQSDTLDSAVQPDAGVGVDSVEPSKELNEPMDASVSQESSSGPAGPGLDGAPDRPDDSPPSEIVADHRFVDAGVDGSDSGTTDGSVPDAGPSKCGTHSWACWTISDSSRYTEVGNGTVKDDVTGLTWEKAAPSNQAFTQAQARARCLQNSGLPGTGWRLPTRIELMSIVDYTKTGAPVVQTSAFPSAQLNPPYWTSSVLDAGKAYAVSFFDGHINYGDPEAMYFSWCVRGNGDTELPATHPPSHYAITVDEVKDTYTALVWQLADARGLTQQGAADYCRAFKDGTWRLPSIKELASLVDETHYGDSRATIDATAFPAAAPAPYWSSSAKWMVDFLDGSIVTGSGAGTAAVRCVR